MTIVERSTERVPPQNLEAEASLLGAMLLSRDAIGAAIDVGVSSSDFYKPAHAHVFDAISVLYGAGEPSDPVTVSEMLRRAGLLEAIGGSSVLVTLQARTPAISSAARYARIVSEHALLRRLIAVAGEIAESAYGLPDDVAATLDLAEARVFEVAERRVADTMAPLRELVEGTLERLEMLYDKGDSVTGLPTGYRDVDELLSGLQPSTLVIVGARPGMGKTAFALGMAAHAVMTVNRPVLFFSLEMSHEEITSRLLSTEARVDSTKMRNGRLADADWTKISHALGRLADAPLYVDDNPMTTVMEIRAKARRLKAQLGDLAMIVVDYLQLMSGRGRAENRQVEVSEISRGLKILARELETPVVALSQLSRALEQRADKRPMLADLRESGCLTADTLVRRADAGGTTTMGDLLRSGERDIVVWSVDEQLRLVPSVMTHVFPSGTKPVFQLRLASGRAVRATANHPFLTLDGWTALGAIPVGTPIAVAGRVPERVLVPKRAPASVRRSGQFVPAGGGGQGAPASARVGTARRRVMRRPLPVVDPFVAGPATPDIGWDEVVAVEPLGHQPVFDATVLGTHNFLANGIVAHNSLEQDADVVMFLHREELYNPETPNRDTAEVIVAKHRSGPVDNLRLTFLKRFTRFHDMAKGI